MAPLASSIPWIPALVPAPMAQPSLLLQLPPQLFFGVSLRLLSETKASLCSVFPTYKNSAATFRIISAASQTVHLLEFNRRNEISLSPTSSWPSYLTRKGLGSLTPDHLQGRSVLLLADICMPQEGECEKEDTLYYKNLMRASVTIDFLTKAGARVVIMSRWKQKKGDYLATRAIADKLEVILKRPVSTVSSHTGTPVKKFIESMPPSSVLLLPSLDGQKEDVSNNAEFARKLADGIDVFVNDAFISSHRALASTVGVSAYVEESMAGLLLKTELTAIGRALSPAGRPLVAIVGGPRISTRLTVLKTLVDKCDRLLITGPMALTLLACQKENSNCKLDSDLAIATSFLKYAEAKGLHLCFSPSSESSIQTHMERPESPKGISTSVLLSVGEDHLASSLAGCQTIVWMGTSFASTSSQWDEGLVLANEVVNCVSASKCEVIISSSEAEALLRKVGVSNETPGFHFINGGTAFLELLQGRPLPGIGVLEPSNLAIPEWRDVFADPTLPLTVDVGCGNGVFVLRMAACHRTHRNFLGIEIIQKLVDRCMVGAESLRLPNGYFICANANRTLGPILRSYPGPISLVTIQCPDPSFGKQKDRRMLHQPLMSAVVRYLQPGGLIFLQSDVKEVALRMQKLLEECGGNQVLLSSLYHEGVEREAEREGEESRREEEEREERRGEDKEGRREVWLHENPFDCPTDWEAHVSAKGGNMYRLMYSKFSKCHVT